MPVLLYVVYPYMLWSVWYETMTGHTIAFPAPIGDSAAQDT